MLMLWSRRSTRSVSSSPKNRCPGLVGDGNTRVCVVICGCAKRSEAPVSTTRHPMLTYKIWPLPLQMYTAGSGLLREGMDAVPEPQVRDAGPQGSPSQSLMESPLRHSPRRKDRAAKDQNREAPESAQALAKVRPVLPLFLEARWVFLFVWTYQQVWVVMLSLKSN